MIFPEEMKLVSTCLSAVGLTGRLIEGKRDFEDDQIEVFRDNNADASVSVVIQLAGARYLVRECRRAGCEMIARGSLPSLRKALDRAIEVVTFFQAQ